MLTLRRFLALSTLTLLSLPLAAQTSDGWQSLFDGQTLGKWKETEFSGHAEVSIKDGTIILPQGGDLTGIHLAEPPARQNYELELKAQRIDGGDFFCGLTFPIGEKCVTFVAGGWGGSVTGISSINGSDASENETTKFKKYKNGQWYLIQVKVTKERIQVRIDDELVVDLETEGRQLAMRVGEIEQSQPLGIATWRTKGAVKDLRWRPLK